MSEWIQVFEIPDWQINDRMKHELKVNIDPESYSALEGIILEVHLDVEVPYALVDMLGGEGPYTSKWPLHALVSNASKRVWRLPAEQ